ncbi:MAG TPA: metallophosphoesterase family protein [Myxococcaceae bacterium]|nr:metallophosphoesterase family protein [Myxococcaceae bacterium]
MRDSAVQVGVVSDTHGLFDRKLVELFRGSSFILHAGDVCGREVLDQLASIAPVLPIFGNCDVAPISMGLPAWRSETIAGHRILIVHDLGKPDRMRPAAAALVAKTEPNIVISGHSHQGRIALHQGILFVNPGSAGKKRFRLLRSAALLSLKKGEARASLFSLESIAPTRVAETSWRLGDSGGWTQAQPSAGSPQ